MNTEIRLFNETGGPLDQFLEGSTYDEILEFLQETLKNIIRELEAGLVPVEEAVLLFDTAAYLYEENHGEGTFKEDLLNILIRKSQDYNADQIEDPDYRLDGAREYYFPFGDKSYLQMIHTKVTRIVTVSAKRGELNFESVSDSLIDLGSYLIFYYSYLCDHYGAYLRDEIT